VFALRYHPGVKKDLRKIHPDILQKLEQAFLDLAANPWLGYKLKGQYEGLMAYDFSYRYRVIYQPDSAHRTVTIYEVWHRSQDYKP